MANSCPLASRVLRLSRNIYKERLVEKNQEINRQCLWWRAEIEIFVAQIRYFQKLFLPWGCHFWAASVTHRGKWGSSPGTDLVLLQWASHPLICTLWVLNPKGTFWGTEPRALEEGHTVKLCFLRSLPSIGAAVLAEDQSSGIHSCTVLRLFLLAQVTPLSSFLFGFSRMSFINCMARHSPGVWEWGWGGHRAAGVPNKPSICPGLTLLAAVLCPAPTHCPRLVPNSLTSDGKRNGGFWTASNSLELLRSLVMAFYLNSR